MTMGWRWRSNGSCCHKIKEGRKSGHRARPVTKHMARGWESKAVEEQIESAEAVFPVKELPSGDRLELERKKQGVVLSRTKVLRDLETCRNARYKDMLVSALADLELQLER